MNHSLSTKCKGATTQLFSYSLGHFVILQILVLKVYAKALPYNGPDGISH